MGKYFGTDGVRGRSNYELDALMAYKVGRYLGYYFSKNKKAKILIGKDTRLSGSMFESALASGISASGADAYLVGYCPTPAISYLVKNYDFDCGAMISASHNPYYDNGIKVFNREGIKLSGDIENLIEEYIDNKVDIEYAHDDNIGRVIEYKEGLDLYLDNMKKVFDIDLSNYNILIDTANGSATYSAYNVLTSLGAKVVSINDKPNGLNINTNCGSTHPESAIREIQNNKYDIGFCFDGDADRLIGINSKGDLITGDHVLYVVSKYLKERNLLRNNVVVTTVMANIGFFKAMDKHNIEYRSTNVGDKYVYEEMVKNDFIIGGEQSGHIIFKDYESTGDGLFTALYLLKIMKDTNSSIEELCEGIDIYPQVLTNLHVLDKNVVINDSDILKEVDNVSKLLSDDGRILFRTSGTEPLVRVMVEAKTIDICNDMIKRVTDLIEKKYEVL